MTRRPSPSISSLGRIAIVTALTALACSSDVSNEESPDSGRQSPAEDDDEVPEPDAGRNGSGGTGSDGKPSGGKGGNGGDPNEEGEPVPEPETGPTDGGPTAPGEVRCPGRAASCSVDELCRQNIDGAFDGCVDTCPSERTCGNACCANGASCVEERCRLPDLSISADGMAAPTFESVEVPSDSCAIQEGCFDQGGLRSVLGVVATVANRGAGDFQLGEPWNNELFHDSPCFDSYLLANFIRAEVLDAEGEVVDTQFLPTSCVADAQGNYRCSLQGLGRGDSTEQPLGGCNSVDITTLSPGSYTLRLTVNPERTFGESDFENNSVEVEFEKTDCDGTMCGGVCCPADVECVDGTCLLPNLGVNAEVIEGSLFITRQEFGKDSCEISEMCVGGPGVRRLLNFEGRIENWGPGPLDPGAEEGNPLFEFSECHGHHHFLDFTDYRLLTQEGEVIATGHKQSFCLVDMVPLGGTEPASYGLRPPGEGGCSYLSAGWADVYGVGTPCQWVDITDVPPGDYLLQVSVNPLGSIVETSMENNVVQVAVIIEEELPCQETEVCGNTTDDDCDSMPDSHDLDCVGFEGYELAEGNTSCEAAIELSGDARFEADVAGDSGSVSPSCGGQGGDAFYRFTLGEPEVVYAGAAFSDVDTVLALYAGGCDGTEVACTDDDCGVDGHFARLLDAGTYTLVVKAKEASASGKLRMSFQRTGVGQGTLIEAPGVIAGDTSLSTNDVASVCGEYSLGPCCDEANACDWAKDGVCDCAATQQWDAADCAGVAPGSKPDGNLTDTPSPDDIYFLPLCSAGSVFASTCGASTFDSALAFYAGSLDGEANACSVPTDSYYGYYGVSSACSSDVDGATIAGFYREHGVGFIVVDGESAGAAGEYQLFVSY